MGQALAAGRPRPLMRETALSSKPGIQPSLPASLWHAISEYRHEQRIGTETEAVRRLLQLALDGASRRESLPG